jgi:hypothetical protein
VLLPVRSTVFTGRRVAQTLRTVIEAPLEATTTYARARTRVQRPTATRRGREWLMRLGARGHTGKNRDMSRAAGSTGPAGEFDRAPRTQGSRLTCVGQVTEVTRDA